MNKSTPKFTKCHACDRGGNGNAEDKCACGWRQTEPSFKGCYIGSPIVGDLKPKPKPKLTRGQLKYRRFLDMGDCFDSFIDFCRYDDANQTR